MKIKPAKSPSRLIWRGVRKDDISFSIDGEEIPCLIDQPVSSLERLFTEDMPDKHIRKLKVWCYWFTLYHHLMWPLKLCDITSSAVQKTDSKPANNYIWKWLPWSLSNTALFERNDLKLPMKSISLGHIFQQSSGENVDIEVMCQKRKCCQHMKTFCRKSLWSRPWAAVTFDE